MFGLSADKIIILLVIAAFLLGPSRLPVAARWLADVTRRFNTFASEAKERIGDQIGVDADEITWQRLDPRQYDPRRIIRDALLSPEAGDCEGSSESLITEPRHAASHSPRQLGSEPMPMSLPAEPGAASEL